MRERRSWRRRVTVTLMLLLAGAAVNVAVAWGISQTAGPIALNQVRVPRFAEHYWNATGEWWKVTYLDEVGMANISTRRQRGDFRADPRKQIATDELPSWSMFRESRSPAKGNVLPFVREWARGFPMLSMYLRIENDSATYRYVIGHAIRAPFRQQSAPGWPVNPEQLLPVGIVWRGFVFNTIVYAAIGWMLTMCVSALRRRRRLKRGRCPACAYPIGTSEVCTECGQALRSPPSRPLVAAL